MAKIKFREIKMGANNKKRLGQINAIIEEYQEQDYVLTLRQLYYQLVSRDIIPNKQTEYSKLSTILKEGRMAGIVDWDAIEDRLRKPSTPGSWESPADILDTAAQAFMLPRMADQRNYIEVWVEKDALSGVLKRVTEKYHIPILVNRGYSSASSMYDSFKRFDSAQDRSQDVHILYLGDFDPSGIDMIRDIEARTREFIEGQYGDPYAFNFTVTPIALTRQQIRDYSPPPNPAKMSDPRAGGFVAEHGRTSWEVDALRPEVLNQILTDEIINLIDEDMYDNIVSQESDMRKKLHNLSQYL